MANNFIQLKLPAKIESLREFTAFVHNAAQEAAFPEMDLGRLDLVMEEVVVNVINYAYPDSQPGNIEVGYAIEGPGKLSVQVCDSGRAFDPLAKDPPDLRLGLADRPIGGLGIFLVKQIARSISYNRDGDQNILTFCLEVEP
ncbi:MAG TPA: ATP-binding protein [Terriglobia bacterium]|nr:ATP-binding protein [Terriglobia bacterium]